jgi:serine/threonine-protein kinase
MHVCLKCGHLNRAGARFCGRCGYSLTAPDLPTAPMLQCDACGHMNRAGDEVCASCGSRLARPAVTAPLRGPRMGTGMLNPQTPLQGRYADSRIPGKRWALKEMSDAALGSAQERAEAVAAFRQEAQVLATLSHPNLPAVVDFFSEGGKQYLVMEFVEGETLESKLAQAPGPLDQALVFDWALQLCDVLSYLHTRQPPVIFRDLKPANIMVGPAGHVKLVDFGIARFFKPGKRGDTQAMGTPGYAPPEQYGRAQTDSRSDVYSLGVTLHHLLTGRDPSWMPFQFAPVSDLNPAVPRAVADVIQRAVSQRPADRFASADEMRQALLAAGAPPPTARAVSWLTTGAMPLPL